MSFGPHFELWSVVQRWILGNNLDHMKSSKALSCLPHSIWLNFIRFPCFYFIMEDRKLSWWNVLILHCPFLFLWQPLSNWRHHTEVAISDIIGWLSPNHSQCKRHRYFSSWPDIKVDLLNRSLQHVCVCVVSSWSRGRQFCNQNIVCKLFTQQVLYVAFKIQRSLRHTHGRSYQLRSDTRHFSQVT